MTTADWFALVAFGDELRSVNTLQIVRGNWWKKQRSLMKLERRQLKTLDGCACVQYYHVITITMTTHDHKAKKMKIEDFSLELWSQKRNLSKKDIWRFRKEKRHVLKWTRRFLTVECSTFFRLFEIPKKKTLESRNMYFKVQNCLNFQELCTFIWNHLWCLIHEVSRSQT